MTTRITITADSAVADGHGNKYSPGQVVEVDDTLAESWIAAGYAAKDTSKRQPTKADQEIATSEPPSNTAARTSRKSTNK